MRCSYVASQFVITFQFVINYYKLERYYKLGRNTAMLNSIFFSSCHGTATTFF